MKKIFLLAFVSVLLSTAVVVRFVNPVVSYLTETELLMVVDLPVHNIDSGKNFSTIQGAINDNETLDGHTIFVEAGTHYEHYLVVNKSVSLVGENRHNTIIDGIGGEKGNVVTVTADYVNISQFTIRNSGGGFWYPYSGICLHSSGNSLRDNIVSNNYFGIFLCKGFSNNTVVDNTISNNLEYGIRLDFSCCNNSIISNTISDNGDQGIRLDALCEDNIIIGNNLSRNKGGIRLSISGNNVIIGNTISNSWWCGISLAEIESSGNIIYHNNFIDNRIQILNDGINTWDDGYPSGGNYWSNYNGTDFNSGPNQDQPGSDGIGDTEHVINENNTDNYPLMGMFSDFLVTFEEELFHVTAVCNSTISAFEFDQVNGIIRFNVTGEEGMGFCRVEIPNVIVDGMWQGDYTVLVNGETVEFRNWTEGSQTYIYFTYQHSEHEVMIVPEFLTWTSILLLFVILTVVIALYKRRLLKTPIH